MKQSFTALLLATTLLLVSTTACSKKEEDPASIPTPTVTAASETGSYTLDGRTTTCTAKCIVAEDYDANKQPIHKLLVSLFSGGNTGLITEVAVLTFTKPFGAATSAYQFQGVNIRSENVTPRTQRSYLNARKYTVTKTSSGGYSGTFEATSDASTANPTSSAITQGVFTDDQQ
jgi:hypothetical protein